MLTLDEAIKHCEKKVIEQVSCSNIKCSGEHKQLAEWLKELKVYRKKYGHSNWKSPLEIWSCIQALGVKPIKDGNQWSFLYGDNIQEGIVGFGDTIYEAACNFYEQITNDKIVK